MVYQKTFVKKNGREVGLLSTGRVRTYTETDHKNCRGGAGTGGAQSVKTIHNKEFDRECRPLNRSPDYPRLSQRKFTWNISTLDRRLKI